MGEKASLPARAGLRGAHSPVQVVARGARGPLGGGCGVLREPGKAETHIARLRGPGPLVPLESTACQRTTWAREGGAGGTCERF